MPRTAFILTYQPLLRTPDVCQLDPAVHVPATLVQAHIKHGHTQHLAGPSHRPLHKEEEKTREREQKKQSRAEYTHTHTHTPLCLSVVCVALLAGGAARVASGAARVVGGSAGLFFFFMDVRIAWTGKVLRVPMPTICIFGCSGRKSAASGRCWGKKIKISPRLSRKQKSCRSPAPSNLSTCQHVNVYSRRMD